MGRKDKNVTVWKIQKIVRSPSASSILRPRKLPPFFKITIVVLAAYVIWSFNHPQDSSYTSNLHKRPTRTLNQLQPPGQLQPLAPGPHTVNRGNTNINPANPPVGSAPAGSSSLVSASEVAGATSEKQQAILESLRKIRWRQKMMEQLQNELFPKNGQDVAQVPLGQGIDNKELPLSLVVAQQNLKAAQAQLAVNHGMVPGENGFAPVAQASASMPVSSDSSAGPAQEEAKPDFMNMSLEDLMKMNVGAGGIVGEEPAGDAEHHISTEEHIKATSVFGQLGGEVPFRTPLPETDMINRFGPLDSQYFPQCGDTGKSHNVVFLKTHKTGSSTMSNIMLRYADTHNLTVGLPLEGKWELGGYPAYIDKRLIDPQLPKYNILGHHFRFNTENLNNIMPDDTKYITIIRSPVDNVESVFGFFQDQEPFIHWMDDIETTQRLGTFYADPTRFFNTETDWFFRSKNHMFFDIGFNVINDEDAYIDQTIATIDKTFTFILLTDFFDESLILMKNLLCWDWDDVVYIKFKMRTDEAKATINPTLAEQIKRWNRSDFKLYDYFNNTFWQRVDQFGRDRMDAELVEFRERQKAAEYECIDSYQPFKKKPWILGAKLRPHPSEKCKQLAWSETVYGEHLREKMYAKIPSLERPGFDQKVQLQTLFSEVAEGALRVT